MSHPNNNINKRLLKLEDQCTRLTTKLIAQEERIRAQDEQLDAILKQVIQKNEQLRKLQQQLNKQQQQHQQDNNNTPQSTGRAPMRKMSIGGGLQYLLYQHAEQPLANDLLDLSTIECPFGSTSEDGTTLWRTAMLVADCLWTAPERQCIIRAAMTMSHRDDDDDDKEQVTTICNSIDQWAIRLTAIVSGKSMALLKPYLMGLAHNLVRGQVFHLRSYKIEWSSPDASFKYHESTPLRDWIVQQEHERDESSLSPPGVEPETKRPRTDGGVI